MKALLVSVMLLTGFGSMVSAQPLTLDLGETKLVLPLQLVSAVQMYDLDENRGFTGAETVVLQRGDLDLGIGAATGYGNGISFPFVSAKIKLPSPWFDTSDNELKFGAFLGRDFDGDDTKWGLAASIALW